MIKKIKTLRELTNNKISLSECRNLLSEANGDIEAALIILASKGIDFKLAVDEYTVNLELRKQYSLGQLITLYEHAALKIHHFKQNTFPKIVVFAPADEIKGAYPESEYAIYTKEDDPEITADMICYLERACEFDENDTAIFPKFVNKENLHEWYLPEIYEDVVGNILIQKDESTMDDYILGLKYYLENDAFFDFNGSVAKF